MAKGGTKSTLGSWAFLIGFIIALLVGLFGSVTGIAAWVLVIIGIIVGLLNIAEKEVQNFLIAGTVLVIVTALSGEIFAGLAFLGTVMQAIMTLFAPATIIVALKQVFSMARG